MKANKLIEVRPFQDVLVYGSPGTGKTTWAARAPRPFVILTEAHGLSAIATVNPHADVHLVDNYKGVLDAIKAMQRGRPCEIEGQPAFQFTLDGETIVCQSVVLDSLTDVQELLKMHVGRGGSAENLTLQDWGKVYTAIQGLLHELRRLPVNFICLALATSTEDDQSVREYKPVLQGKAQALLGQWFSVVGYSQRRAGDKGNVEYLINWQLPGNHITKKPPSWPDFVVNRINKPGSVTLGSLLLATFPGMAVPHNPDDSGDLVDIRDNSIAVVPLTSAEIPLPIEEDDGDEGYISTDDITSLKVAFIKAMAGNKKMAGKSWRQALDTIGVNGDDKIPTELFEELARLVPQSQNQTEAIADFIERT